MVPEVAYTLKLEDGRSGALRIDSFAPDESDKIRCPSSERCIELRAWSGESSVCARLPENLMDVATQVGFAGYYRRDYAPGPNRLTQSTPRQASSSRQNQIERIRRSIARIVRIAISSTR